MSDNWRPPQPLVELPDVIPPGLGEPMLADNGAQVVFEPLRAFLERQLPPAEALVGVTRNGTNLLPRYGWVMPWGREGSAKTSVVVDLLFHAAAGVEWVGYPIDRPLRVVLVVNEGVPGGFQDKLRQKLEAWAGDGDAVLDNLAIYASPWGAFTLRNDAMLEHARAFAIDFGADYVALDPLHTLGSSGSGKPEETEAFKHVLRNFGVWTDLGVITAHHSNKSGMVSGDWARHPDTVLHLEKDGKRPATKLTVEKARPADPAELGVPFLLEWVPDTFGYRRVAIEAPARTSDAEVLAKILAALADTAPLNMGELQKAVGGDTKRVQAVVKAELAKRENGAVRNISTSANAYALVPGEYEITGATGEADDDAQTRIDTENLSGETPPPESTGEGSQPMGDGLSGGPVGGYVVPPPEHPPERQPVTDNLDDLF